MKIQADWLACLVLYILVILSYGYTFGGNDQMDFMPYALHLQDPSLFTKDFYVQCIKGHINERYVLSNFISFIPHQYWKILFLLLHFCFSILLILGLIKFSRLFIKERWISYFIVCTTLIFSYHINLGGNELYYNMLCGSLISKSLGIWALYHGYKNNLKDSILLSILATYIHPIAGVQILFLTGLLFSSKSMLKYYLFTILFISPYIFLLVKDLDSNLPSALFSEIMRLRNAHHFFPNSFPIKSYVLLAPLFIFGSIAWKDQAVKIYRVCIIILLGCIIYSLLLFMMPKWAIMSQWFKTTIWLKFLCILSITKFLSHRVQFNVAKKYLIVVTLLFTCFKYLKQTNITANFSPFTETKNVLVAREIREQSTPEDLFLVPPDFTEFKYFAQRSTFIDWKAIPHNGVCLTEWQRRIKLAYGLDSTSEKNLNAIYAQSHKYIQNLDSMSLRKLKMEGVTKIISKVNNSEWRVQKL